LAYADVNAVQALNTTRTAYSTSTKPTLVQVTEIIDEISGEIDAVLAQHAVLVPVTAPASFVKWLKNLNALGAAAQAEMAAFPEFDSGQGSSPQGNRYWRMYQDGLKLLVDGIAIDPAAATSSDDTRARTFLTDYPDNDPQDAGFTEGQQPAFSMSSKLRDF